MAPELIVESAILWLVFGLLSYAIAKDRGHDNLGWLGFSLLLGIFGFVFLLLPNTDKSHNDPLVTR